MRAVILVMVMLASTVSASAEGAYVIGSRHDGSGMWGAFLVDAPSRAVVRDRALEECERYATDCSIHNYMTDKCGAAIASRPDGATMRTIVVVIDKSRDRATEQAFDQCPSKNGCGELVTACDGKKQ